MKLLITGGSGFLGWHVAQRARQDWEVIAVGRSRSLDLPGVTAVKLDLTDFETLKSFFQALQPAAVIHLAAQSRANLCETQPEDSYRLNVAASWNLAGLCADAAIPCAFTSTDLVFDGLHAPYRETDPVAPVNSYGEQKVLAEQGMLDRYPSVAVCRMPLLFGDVPPHATSFLQPFIRTLREGQELQLFVDEFRTPVSGATAATGLLLALQKVQGIIHLGGKERISRYEFGRLMVETLDLPATGLRASRQADVPMAAKRPPDVSLNSAKAFSLGYEPPSLRDELWALKGKV